VSKTKIILLLVIFTVILSSTVATADVVDNISIVDELVSENQELTAETQYEYVPIEHTEIVTNLRDDEDVEPIKPFYIPTAEELAENTPGENELQATSNGVATASITEADVWSDVLSQAYGEDYFAHHLKYDDGVRVSEFTNKLVIENTDLTLKGKNGLDVVLKRKYDNQYTNQSFYTTRIYSTLQQHRYLYKYTINSNTIYIAFKTTDIYYEYMHDKMVYISSLPTETRTFTEIVEETEYIGYYFEDIYELKTDASPKYRLIDTGEEPMYVRYQSLYTLEPCGMNLRSSTYELGNGWVFDLPEAHLAYTDVEIFGEETRQYYSGSFRTLSGDVCSMTGRIVTDKDEDPIEVNTSFSSEDARYYPEMFYERQTKEGIQYDFTIYDAGTGHTYYFYIPEKKAAQIHIKVVAVCDEFGNCIKYEYTDNTVNSKLSKIIDTYGRVIDFTYETVENSSTNEHTLTISYTEGNQQKSITYKKEILPSTTLINHSSLQEKPVHKFSVTNQQGETTEYYSREAETIITSEGVPIYQNIDDDIYDCSVFYVSKSYNVEQILYPTGLISNYTYERKPYCLPSTLIVREYYVLSNSYDKKKRR